LLDLIFAVPLVDEKTIYWRDRMIEHARSINDYRSYAQFQLKPDEWICLDELWERESGWRTHRTPHLRANRSSGAYGIPQSLPASKMATAGYDYRWNPITQVKWGLSYIKERYGSACKALEHHDKKNWY
jgi:hypothetical protein